MGDPDLPTYLPCPLNDLLAKDSCAEELLQAIILWSLWLLGVGLCGDSFEARDENTKTTQPWDQLKAPFGDTILPTRWRNIILQTIAGFPS